MRAVNFGEQEACLPDNIISTWETGNLDPAYYFDRALNVLGYELQIMEKGGKHSGK